VLWFIYNDSLKITLLDSDSQFPTPFSATVLKGLVSSNKELYEPIANCDPFIKYGPNVTLPPSRYWFIGNIPFHGAGGQDVFTFTHFVEKADLQSNMKYSIRVEEVEAGWLGSLGISPNNETSTTTMETSQSLSNQTRVGQRVTASMHYSLSVDESAIFEVYFDRVFGSFVVRLKSSAKSHVDSK
jgi:hypothetical protein